MTDIKRVEYKRVEVSGDPEVQVSRIFMKMPVEQVAVTGAADTYRIYEVHGRDGSEYAVVSSLRNDPYKARCYVVNLTDEITTADEKIGKWVHAVERKQTAQDDLAGYLNAQAS